MKILQVSCNDLSNGGVQNVFMNIVSHMPDITFDLIVFGNGDEYYRDKFLHYGGRIFRFPIYQGDNKWIARIDRMTYALRLPIYIMYINFRYGHYDAIHCHNYFEAFCCNFGAYLSGIKVRIAHCHNSEDPSENIRYKRYAHFLRDCFERFTNVKIGCSKKALEYLFGDDKKGRVINNFIDVNMFLSKKNEYITSTNIFSFVHIGRFCFQKNQLFLLEVFRIIHNLEPNARLSLQGYGPDEIKLRTFIKENNLEKCVQIFPHNYDKFKILSENNVMIFPSIFEGFGIVLLEAQIMDCLCFVSDAIPSNTDMGLEEVIPLKLNASEWANIILTKLKNIDTKEKKKEYNSFDINSIMPIYREIYEGKSV